jgi:cytochrome c biogenesis protein CcmG, thiol:disulfide interchange protein DsbE
MTDYINQAPMSVPDIEQTDNGGTPAAAVGKKRTPFGKLLIWLAVISFLMVIGWGLVRATAERPDGSAPNFEMQFFDGYGWDNRQNASLDDFEGKVIVLNFWASWCVECLLEAELLEQTWQQYADKDVVFLGVAYVDVEPKSIEYLEQFNITYPNAPDLRSTISSKYEITGVPETFFINKDGEIVHIQIGPVDETILTTVLDQMVNEG